MSSDTLVCIHAHLSDYQRLHVCSELVNKIKNFGYEVIVTSHTPAPIDFQQSVDYFVYDKDNYILKNIEYLGYLIWYTPNFDISSKEFNTNNTVLAVLRLMHIGASYAKMLGKKKIHIMDYDGLINSPNELMKNEKKIDEGLDGVFYYWETDKTVDYIERGDGHKVRTKLQITTRLMSANVDYLMNCFDKCKDFDEQAKYIATNGLLIGEEYYAQILNLMNNQNVELHDFVKSLDRIQMIQDRMHTHQDFPWICCVIGNPNHLFLMNPHTDMTFKVMINEKDYYEKYFYKGNYQLMTVPESCVIDIYTNGKFFRQYDLTNDQEKDRLKVCNSIYFKG